MMSEEKEDFLPKDANDNQTDESDKGTENGTKQPKPKNDASTNIFLLLLILGVILGIVLEILNMQRRKHERLDSKPKYWVYGATNNVHNKDGLLHNVHVVLERLGYEKSGNDTSWNLLWAHDYPFTVLAPHLYNLQPHQKVNHFPGTGFITNKVDLATTESKYIPKAFRLPKQKEQFLKYAEKNKNSLFVVKHNQHRGVMLKNVTEIDLDSKSSFVQEYMQNPFLVDGYKFDIGVYIVLTSVNPLRVYWYKGDVLFRYCPKPYEPFDPLILDKYVVADDYLPPWDVPSLSRLYKDLGYSMRDAFDIYVRSKGGDTAKMWDEVQNAIAEIFIKKEKHIIEALKKYPSQKNFFELMRVDLVVDADLRVRLLEANMSPNLSAAHFPRNQLLFQQVIYNLMNLVGVASALNANRPHHHSEQLKSEQMISAEKNIVVWGKECNSTCDAHAQCADSAEESAAAARGACGVCAPCLPPNLRRSLLRAHTEHLHRGDFRRLIPPPMKPGSSADSLDLSGLSAMNQLQHIWYQGKCNLDITWCH